MERERIFSEVSFEEGHPGTWHGHIFEWIMGTFGTFFKKVIQ